MPKATTKTAATTTETEAQAVKVPAKAMAALKACITSSATADSSVKAAIATSEQSLVKVRTAILDAGFADKDEARIVVKPLFHEAYTKAGLSKDYADQQLSRVLGLAFPKDAKATAHVERAIKENKPINTVIALSTGRKAYTKKGEVIDVKKDNRGGKNALKPLDSFGKSIDDAVTAASVAKLDAEQLLNRFVEALKACELIEDASELADLLKD